MTKNFSPEHVKLFNPETKSRDFSDIWGLTCAQLGSTFEELIKVRPDATLKKSDIAGYYYIQYGVDDQTTNDVIDMIEKNHWEHWAPAQRLKRVLPRIVGTTTEKAVVERVMLGNEYKLDNLVLEPEITEYFDIVEEENHEGARVRSLYPKENLGLEVEYRGRSRINLGEVAIGGYREADFEISADLLTIKSEHSETVQNLLVMSRNTDIFPPVEQIRIL